MRKFFAFLAGIMCGALVGGATALLLAPMSGQELQDEVADRFEQLKTEVEAAIAEQEQRLRTEFERMKEEIA